MSNHELLAVSTEIGRGHPSYLDSVLRVLRDDHGVDVPVLTLDRVCAGRSKKAWDLACTFYRAGARGGAFTWLYNRARTEDSRPAAWQLNLLGRDLARRFEGFPGTCLVEHPLVARILAPVCRTAYLHCEIAAPASAAVPGAWRTFVPLETTAARLVAHGVDHRSLTITGLVVEPDIVRIADAAYRARLLRLGSIDDEPSDGTRAKNAERQSTTEDGLTVAFFTSGAYPRPHLERTFSAAASALEAGHRVIVFAGTDPERAEAIGARLALHGPVTPANPSRRGTERLDAGDGTSCLLVCSDSRQEETANTALLFPRFDVMVAAAHERTNWAVGLGLPMFALLPNIGPFAPQNFRFALDQGVCLPLPGRGTRSELPGNSVMSPFGPWLTELHRSGRLAAMAERGYGPLPIGGAAVAASALLAGCT